MKKTYINPELFCVRIGVSSIVAESTPIDPTKTIEDNNDIGVKSNTPSYNVWDDDWSR